MKKIAALILAAVMLLGLAACSAKPQDYTYKELKITLTDKFREADLEGYDKCFDSSTAAVFVLREDKSLLGGLTLSLEEYANLVYSANVNRNPEAVKVENGIYCFEYEFKNETENMVYHYYTTIFESDQAFWLVQFATRQDDWTKLQAEVKGYAQSVRFE